jgi:hypothetical protein
MLPVTIGVPRTSQVTNNSTKNLAKYSIVKEVLTNAENLTIVRSKNLGVINFSKHRRSLRCKTIVNAENIILVDILTPETIENLGDVHGSKRRNQ